jgi:hypothetical protein
MYVVGFDESPGSGNTQWRIEKRNLTDGSLVTAFGTNGVVTSNPSVDSDYAYAIAIDSSAMYVVGYDRSPGYGNTQWRIEKRSLTNGSLVTAFGTNGVITSNPSAYGDYANDIAIDSSGMYVVGYDHSPSNVSFQWRIEKRSLADGSLVTAFGTNGVITSNPNSIAEAIAIDSTYMYVAGYQGQWRIEKRGLTDGSLVTAFGTNGVVTSNPNDEANAIAIDSSAMYVVGYDSSPGSSNYQWRIEKRLK